MNKRQKKKMMAKKGVELIANIEPGEVIVFFENHIVKMNLYSYRIRDDCSSVTCDLFPTKPMIEIECDHIDQIFGNKEIDVYKHCWKHWGGYRRGESK